MARYVIDAPTLLHLVETGLQVGHGHQLVAPNSIRSEALELLLRDVRAGKRAEAAAMEAHERMTGIKIRLLGDRVSRRTAWQLARQHDWDTLRDAEYLAVTRLQADALVTVDQNLAAAARDIVAVADLDALLAPG
jgi:predicted nucleic acid-binding protein